MRLEAGCLTGVKRLKERHRYIEVYGTLLRENTMAHSQVHLQIIGAWCLADERLRAKDPCGAVQPDGWRRSALN